MLPAEVGSRLARITHKRIDFGRAEITWVDLNEHPAGRLLEAFLLDAATAPGESDPPAPPIEGATDGHNAPEKTEPPAREQPAPRPVAAVPLQPGWSGAAVYYHDSVSASVRLGS